jgi:hypothetical protein
MADRKSKNQNDYWSGQAEELGVYSWSDAKNDWELIHRGPTEN